MFNSPLAWCPIVRAYVALDEPNHACRAEHRCATGDCPLKGLFASAALVVHEAHVEDAEGESRNRKE